ncbi:MAG: PAS domain-containing protein [Planctomycetes bacterium]|nr:PAS domain-containing protein [Planctomycetota bacterium]
MTVSTREPPAPPTGHVFEDIADGMPHMLWLADPDGATTYHNRRILDYAGLPAGTTLGSGWEHLLHPDDLPATRAVWAHAVATGEPFEAEYRLRRHDGTYRWFLARADAQRDDRNRVGRWVGTCTDVDDRKAAATRFQAIIEKSFDAVDLIAADGTILYASPPGVRLLGHPPEDDVGLNGFDLVHPDDVDRVRGEFERLLATPGASLDSTHRLRHRGGHYLWVESRATNLLHVPAVGAVVVNFRDVTRRKRAEEQSRVAAERLAAVVAAAPMAFWAIDRDGTRTLSMGNLLKKWGLEPNEMVGSSVFEAGTCVPDMLDAARRVLAGESPSGVTTAGAETFEWWYYPLRGDDGAVAGGFGMALDATDRKRAQDRLRESEHNLSEAQRIAHLGHWEQDLDTGRITASDETHRIFGLPLREGLDTWEAWQGCIHPDDRPGRAAAIDRTLRNGRPYEAEYRVVRPDGGTRVVHSWGEVTQVGAGRPRRLFGIVRDVTERRHADRALLDAERRLEHVVASSPAVLFTIRVEGGQFRDIGWVSENVVAVLGYRVEETLESGWWMGHIHPEDRDAVVSQFGSEIFSTNSFSTEYQFRHKDGRYRWIRGETRLLRDAAGEPVEVVGSLSDITERRRLEDQFRQAQKMDAFGQLAGGVAHDFNNLLTVINGYSDLLLGTLPAGDPSRESVAEIHKAGERSAGLTRQLLAFSRKQVLAPRVLDLTAVVAETASMLRRVIGEDVTLSTATAHGLWPVKADPGQVEQVLMNLAVNARDAMPTGGRLTIETQNVDLDETYAAAHLGSVAGPHVLLAVSDTGCGMTPEVLAKIFEPFFTTKEPGKGTGLGLATVYGIVAQSGGHVGVYSEVGAGTTFKVYLPRTEHASGVTKSHSALRVPPRGTETVLVVEDDAAVRTLTRHILGRAGYAVLEAAGGNEALRVAADHPGTIHLLVTDVVMPGLGGPAAAELLAERRPGLRVLFVSGYTDDAVVRHGILHDKVNFLQKPFAPTALAWKVREVLDQPQA